MRPRDMMRRRTPALLVLLVTAITGGLWAATRVTPEPAAYDASLACRRLVLRGPDGEALLGQVEDMAWDGVRDELIVSVYDRKTDRPGGLFAASIDAVEGAQTALHLRALIDDAALDRPHGIALGYGRLAVVARGPRGGAKIRVLARTKEGWRAAGTLNHPQACRANDLAWAQRNNLFVSIDGAACAGPTAWLERIVGARPSLVLRWSLDDGETAVAADHFRFANGLAFTNGRAIAADTRDRAARVYAAAPVRAARLPVQTFDTYALPGAPDNLSVTEGDRVLAALHPNLMRLAVSRYGPFSKAPGRIAVIDGDQVRTLLDDPSGDVIPGATVAVELKPGLLAVGSVTAPGLSVCDLRDAP